MSHKHHIEVAAMLNEQRAKSSPAEAWRVSEITLELALMFKRDNPRFDAGKFFEAAGFPELTGSRMGLN